MFDKQYEHFKSICQDSGIKITSQRFIIFETLKSVTCHPTVDQLYEMVHKQIPSLSKDTVYRTLNMFAERGLA
ncbi:MAG: transcriptional repressor, partial [Candidatus Adiutrix sp.]|nr:transcriptional repressor [Candidatus Adiutrix sp.]